MNNDPAMFSSGYDKIPNDLYETPEWMVRPLEPHIFYKMKVGGVFPQSGSNIWEPACGNGAISKVLANELGYQVISTDLIDRGFGEGNKDFLTAELPNDDVNVILTNPPFGDRGKMSEAFMRHGLDLMRKRHERTGKAGAVIMLQRSDYDAAKTRKDIFGECSDYSGKISFAKRPVWIKGSTGSPRHYYSWYVWIVSPFKSDDHEKSITYVY